MVWASHRAEHEFFVVDFYWRVHVLFIIRVVAGLLIKSELSDVGSYDMFITAFNFFFHHKLLQLSPYRCTFLRIKRQTFTYRVGKHEKVEFFPNHPMVILI